MQDDDIDLPPEELESMLLIERLAEGMLWSPKGHQVQANTGGTYAHTGVSTTPKPPQDVQLELAEVEPEPPLPPSAYSPDQGACGCYVYNDA